MKALRTYYSRPYFLPPMVEMGAINIVAMASPVDEDTPFGQRHYKLLVSKLATDKLYSPADHIQCTVNSKLFE